MDAVKGTRNIGQQQSNLTALLKRKKPLAHREGIEIDMADVLLKCPLCTAESTGGCEEGRKDFVDDALADLGQKIC